MQEVITTPAPIPILTLKRKFSEDLHFEIEYSKSKFKGKSFLTYLSNLKVEVDLLVDGEADLMELTAAYLEVPVMFYQEALVGIVVNLLLIREGLPGSVPFDPQAFFEAHGAALDIWAERLDMCPLYATRVLIGEEVIGDPALWPGVDETASGLNWVHCLNHPGMALYFAQGRPVRYSKHWFEGRVFAGKNLYHHFESRDNVLFAIIGALHEPELHEGFVGLMKTHDQLLPELLEA